MADATTSQAVPNPATAATGSGTANPYLPQTVGQQQVPTYANSMANDQAPTAMQGLNIFGQTGNNTNGQPNWVPSEHDFVKAMYKAGFSAGDAALLYNFISSGAGFNPQVAQGLLNSMQPEIQRGQANILEHFGQHGLTGSTPAAISFGDYMGQIEATQQQMIAQMYEQSVQNYMNVLLSGKRQMKPVGGTFDNLMSTISTGASAFKDISSGIQSLNNSGGSQQHP